jgi:hypothetical protein
LSVVAVAAGVDVGALEVAVKAGADVAGLFPGSVVGLGLVPELQASMDAMSEAIANVAQRLPVLMICSSTPYLQPIVLSIC